MILIGFLINRQMNTESDMSSIFQCTYLKIVPKHTSPFLSPAIHLQEKERKTVAFILKNAEWITFVFLHRTEVNYYIKTITTCQTRHFDIFSDNLCYYYYPHINPLLTCLSTNGFIKPHHVYTLISSQQSLGSYFTQKQQLSIVSQNYKVTIANCDDSPCFPQVLVLWPLVSLSGLTSPDHVSWVNSCLVPLPRKPWRQNKQPPTRRGSKRGPRMHHAKMILMFSTFVVLSV